jgi:hypothetical protein
MRSWSRGEMDKKLTKDKVNKWRQCPNGEHWVGEHMTTILGVHKIGASP